MPMQRDDIEDIYELSPLQEVMLFQTLYAPESGIYLDQTSFTFRGPINIPAFKRAWQRVIEHYPILRTTFYWELDKPLQVVRSSATMSCAEEDWRGLSPSEQQTRLAALIATDRKRGFDLSEAPLMRLACIRMADDLVHFVWSFHHILLDGWSIQLVIKNVSACYESLCRGREMQLEPSRPYGDFIAWIQQQDVSQAERYWRRTLKGINAPTRLKLKSSSESAAPYEEQYEESWLKVPQSTTAALQDFCRLHQLTLNTVVQGAWAILLSRYSMEQEVIFGAIVSGRPATLSGVESMVGLFINALPVRVSVSREAQLVTWLKELQVEQFEARKYEFCNQVQVQGWSEVPRGTLLFENVLIFENFPMDNSFRTLDDQQGRHFEKTNLPLTVMVAPGNEILIKAQFNCRDFCLPEIERILSQLLAAFHSIATKPDQKVGAVNLFSDTEQQLLSSWNATSTDYLAGQSVTRLFEEQVELTPNATAFISGADKLSYRVLNERSNQLAHRLKSLGVEQEVMVGVCLERSLDLAVALLAIFKAGGAYLPLDPAYPSSRLTFMLDDVKPRVLITRERFVPLVSGHQTTIFVDSEAESISHEETANLAGSTSTDQIAYVIYTSGSTGRPKGVAVEHRQVLNRLAWMWDVYPFDPGEVGCQKTPLNFVDSIWELLGPLLKGIPSVIVPDDVLKDPRELVDSLAAHNVTRLWLVPSLLRLLLDEIPDLNRRLPQLKFWVTSGEALTPELFQRFRERMPESVLHNVYGTSEIWDATWYDPEKENGATNGAPIGWPIGNVQVHVLDRFMQPVPTGTPGELYVGGAGLARGYLNQPAFTSERFVPDPFSGWRGSRLYKTGDIVRFRVDGNLDYLGREDYQVKIRGHRIELGEIESVIGQHSSVNQAVVVTHEDPAGEKKLVSYLIPANGNAVLVSDLREYLQDQLPDYMVPATFVLLTEFPLTPSGKVDRRALPDPRVAAVQTQNDYSAPRTEMQQTLAAMYAQILGLDRVGIHDNFFRDLGGHSLLATQLVSRLRETWEIELPLRRFFEAPTVARLAVEISRIKATNNVRMPTITRLSREQYRVDTAKT